MEHLFTEIMRSFEGYNIGKMLKYMDDPEIISFAAGMPSDELFPTELIKKTLQRILDDNSAQVLQYSPVQGEKDLMLAVIDYLKRDHVYIAPENILITTSGQHGLDLVGRLFLEPRDTIVCDLPTFGGALAAFEMEAPRYFAKDIQEDGSDIAGMRAGICDLLQKGRTPKFIYVVPDFQNPSGITMSLEKRKALLALGQEFKIPIVEDSPYRELRYSGQDIPSLYTLDDNRGNVIGIYTFSKIFNPGLRVGFNIGPPEVIKKFSFIKGANILNTPKLNQDTCTAFLREYDLDKHFRKARDFYSAKLDFFLETLNEFFSDLKEIYWTAPEGGLFLWMTVPKHINTMELFHAGIKEKVAFVPGELFFPKEYEQFNTIRLNFSYPSKKQVIQGIKRLRNVVNKYL
ncbi:MAG: PLP-dependent aminotransferase family protein [Candidatus Aminicenantes bacterium]|nr:PLP-dependent aminotransferase family protein [Candidatus Aminicenantes bacterium]